MARTRYGRNIKSTPTKAETTAQSKTSPILFNKKPRRQSIAASRRSGTYATCDSGVLTFHDVPRDFLEDLAEKQQRNARKDRFNTGEFTRSDLENDTSTDNSPPRTTSARGRGGRGRGRGRGRGSRGGRGRGGAASASVSREPGTISPLRERKARNAAPTFPLTEVDEDSANQESAADDAKELLRTTEDSDVEDAAENDDDGGDDKMDDVQFESTTPHGSPPTGLGQKVAEAMLKPPPKNIGRGSTSHTPQVTTAPTPVLQMIDPEDDLLSDSDLPGPWVDDYEPPENEAECEDHADFLLQHRFKPMTDVDTLLASLTKFAPAQRSTETLYQLAENTQKILEVWQDEYLVLDAKVRSEVCILIVPADSTDGSACTSAQEAGHWRPHPRQSSRVRGDEGSRPLRLCLRRKKGPRRPESV